MRTRLRNKVTLLFVVPALLLAIPAVAALAQDTSTSTAAPTIQSDKADYAPGELVTLTGSGWQPGESVNVFVNDEEGQTWSRNIDVTADESGNITDQFSLPDWFVATYKVTATGELSGVATTSFTDGNVSAKTSGLSEPIILHWEKFNNNTNCSGFPDFSQGTLMPPNTPQLLTGVDDGQSIRMTLLGGPLVEFVNWTSGSEERTDLRICVAGSTAEQVWTANFGAAPTSVDTTITASNASATYGDSSATLNASVKAASGPAVNAGTVMFTVKKGATTIGTVTSGTVSNGSASASFPLSGVNADTYTIEAAYNAGTGFNASNNSTQSPAPTLTFNKADTRTTVTCGAGTFTYTGSAYEPCSAEVSGPGGLNFTPDVVYANNINAGKATASYTYDESANYLGSSDSKTFTIDEKKLLVNAKDQSTVYGDQNLPPTYELSGFVNNEDKDSAGITGAPECSISGSAGPKVGEYSDAIVCAPGTLSADNYSFAAGSKGKLSITKRAITVTAVNDTKVYDGTVNSSKTPTVTGGIVSGDQANFSQAFDDKNVGQNKTLSPSGSVNDNNGGNNYQLEFVNKTNGEITAKELIASFTAEDKVYDGNDSAKIASRTLQGLVGNEDVSLDGGMAKFNDKNVANGKTVTATGFTLAGNAKDNYKLEAGPWTTTSDINPAPLTVTADNQSKKLGDPNPTFTASYSGFVNGEDKSVLGGTLAFATNVPSPEQVGTWDITPSGLTSSNYTITFVKGTLTITSITYNFSGFRSPVDNPGTGATPVFNSAKAGQSIPVKFGLGGNQGLNIIAAGYPKVTSVNCVSSATVDPIEEYVASTAIGGLTYDAIANQYSYVWKTQSTYVNKCFKFDLRADRRHFQRGVLQVPQVA